jgi:hypothetical protein
MGRSTATSVVEIRGSAVGHTGLGRGAKQAVASACTVGPVRQPRCLAASVAEQRAKEHAAC